MWSWTVIPQAVAESQFRVVAATLRGEQVSVSQCALAARRHRAGSLELLVFGKSQEPLVIGLLKDIDKKQDSPIDLVAQRESESGRITMSFLGKYQTSIRVTELVL